MDFLDCAETLAVKLVCLRVLVGELCMVATLRLGLGSPFPSGSAVPGLQLPPQQLRNVCRASWRPQSLAQEAAARLAGRSRLRRRAEAEGRVEGWWSWRKLGRRFGGGGRPRPLPGCESPGCRRMDGASPGGGGSSGGGGSGGGYGVVARFSQCLAEFRTWLRTNWLRFNADKTDVMLVGKGTIGDEGRARANSLM